MRTGSYTSQSLMPSLTSNQVLDLFRRVGALLEGHFKLSSGLHSPKYLQSALVLQHPREAETLGAALADAARPLKPDVVMSPALGGIVIGQEVAVPSSSLAQLAVPAYQPDACPLCAAGSTAVKPGSRA